MRGIPCVAYEKKISQLFKRLMLYQKEDFTAFDLFKNANFASDPPSLNRKIHFQAIFIQTINVKSKFSKRTFNNEKSRRHYIHRV